MTDRKSEIQRRVNLPGYLDKLECLMGFRSKLETLSSIEFVDEIRDKINRNIKSTAVATTTIPFAERVSAGFVALIEELVMRNSHPVFIWIEKANECGLAPAIRLNDFLFSFGFDSIPEGLISLITSDAKDKLLMDFEEDDDGSRIMTIELHGEHWGGVKFSEFRQPPQ